VNIDAKSPHRSPAVREASAAGRDTKAASSKDEGSSGEGSSSSLDSSSYFVRDADPEIEANELGTKPTAVRLGGKVVKCLRFESRDCERTLLAEAGGLSSFRRWKKI
jgi:hypothetical protein